MEDHAEFDLEKFGDEGYKEIRFVKWTEIQDGWGGMKSKEASEAKKKA
jgi:hypothetical protein